MRAKHIDGWCHMTSTRCWVFQPFKWIRHLNGLTLRPPLDFSTSNIIRHLNGRCYMTYTRHVNFSKSQVLMSQWWPAVATYHIVVYEAGSKKRFSESGAYVKIKVTVWCKDYLIPEQILTLHVINCITVQFILTTSNIITHLIGRCYVTYIRHFNFSTCTI